MSELPSPDHAPRLDVPPAAPPPIVKPPAKRSAIGPLLGAIVPVLCLAGFGIGYLHLHSEMVEIRESQRQLAEEVAGMRKTPIIDVRDAPARGPADAVVTLVEFSDYECPFCIAHFNGTAKTIDAEYVQTGKIRYVFRDLPIDDNHPEAIRAHIAARCAGEQGKFWEMHNRLFSAPGTHKPADLTARATEAGLDLTAFQSCVDSGRPTADIRRVAAIATGFGAAGTPVFFIGMRDPATEQVRILHGITGAQPFETFRKTLDELLK